MVYYRTAKLSRPYFRDWGNLQYHEGKSFIAPPRLFKAELSLYFPNLYGETIVKGDNIPRDTTPVLEGKATVVSIFSSQWAQQQADSFISEKANPALHQVLKESGDLAQIVRVNYEDNAGKAWLIRLFMGSLRRRFPERDWNKYFLVRRGITDHIRESIGLLNSRVGYTYLVDQHCRIRWAGSGPSQEVEREDLAKGLDRLVDGIKKEAKLPASAREKPRPASQRHAAPKQQSC
jgi:ATPase complex subunit ATP10